MVPRLPVQYLFFAFGNEKHCLLTSKENPLPIMGKRLIPTSLESLMYSFIISFPTQRDFVESSKLALIWAKLEHSRKNDLEYCLPRLHTARLPNDIQTTNVRRPPMAWMKYHGPTHNRNYT